MNAVIAALEKQVGPLVLFLTLGTDDNPDSMLTLVVSSVALDHLPSQEGVKLVIGCLKSVATEEIQSSIARVNIRHTNDSLVKTITGLFEIQNGPALLQNVAFNEILITHGRLYRAVRSERAAPP